MCIRDSFNTDMTSTILAPVLSAHSIRLAVFNARGIFAFIPLILTPLLLRRILSYLRGGILRSLQLLPLQRSYMEDYEHGPLIFFSHIAHILHSFSHIFSVRLLFYPFYRLQLLRLRPVLLLTGFH